MAQPAVFRETGRTCLITTYYLKNREDTLSPFSRQEIYAILKTCLSLPDTQTGSVRAG